MTAYSVITAAAFAVSAISFCFILIRLRARKTVPYYSEIRGRASAGRGYAFTKAFAPWEKESARRHLATYLCGMVYHLAIFCMMAVLFLSIFNVRIHFTSGFTIAMFLLLGAVCGFALFIKRFLVGYMRQISVAEDYFANLLVSGTLASAAYALLDPAAIPVFQTTGSVLLLYAPLGKLRHAVFLFASRWHWGEYFGIRGVRPAPQKVWDSRNE